MATRRTITGDIYREDAEYLDDKKRPWCLDISTPDGHHESHHCSAPKAVAVAKKWADDRNVRLTLAVTL